MLALLVAVGLPATARSADDDQTLTPKRLSQRLAAEPRGDAAERLAKQIRDWFGGKEKLAAGPNPKIDGLEVAWAIEAPDAKVVTVISEDRERTLPLVRVGMTDVYAATFPLPDGSAFRWAYDVDGKGLGGFTNTRQRGAGQLELFLE
ncbi:MAG TPA: hypothetical protein VFU81_18615, partial [Thermomicrobiales bacterium]|nr:hypothetical protein [Thermomicrobiales bacterium]